MTIEEKIKMFQEKKAFIEEINRVFSTRPKGSTVESIRYEVWSIPFNDTLSFRELVVVTFFGGAISVRNISGYSNVANFKLIGDLIDGGYYDEVRAYRDLCINGYQRVDL